MPVRSELGAHMAARIAVAEAEVERLKTERDAKLRTKALGRSLTEVEGFAQRETARADAAEAQVAALQRELAQMRAERDSATGMAHAAESKRVALQAALDEVAPGEAERVQAAVSRRLVDQMCAGLPSRPDVPEEIRRLAEGAEQ